MANCVFSHSLTSLDVISKKEGVQQDIQAICTSLPLLESCKIQVRCINGVPQEKEKVVFDLSPFQRCSRLTALMVSRTDYNSSFAGNSENIEQLRTLPHLENLLDTSFSDKEWLRLLRAPSPALTRVRLYVAPPEELVTLFAASLPRLAQLDLPTCIGLDALRGTPNLRSLTLLHENHRFVFNYAHFGLCAQLHTLHISTVVFHNPLQCLPLQGILSRMPHLQTLSIDDAYQLTSLHFLSENKSLSRTLRSLQMRHCNFTSDNVRLHLHCLQQLTQLHLDGACFAGFTADTLCQLKSPSPAFPKLEQSFVGHSMSERERKYFYYF